MAHSTHTQNRYGTHFFLVATATIAAIALLIMAAFQIMTFYFLDASTQTPGSSSILRSTGIIGSSSTRTEKDLVQKDTVQAVFLTNDQAYFGRIVDITNDTIIMESVFYPEQKAEGEAAEGDSNIALNRLGSNEFHQPQSELIITRSNVVYWENLQKDSRVTRGIIEFEEKQAQEAKDAQNKNTNTSNEAAGGGDAAGTYEANTNAATNNAAAE